MKREEEGKGYVMREEWRKKKEREDGVTGGREEVGEEQERTKGW